MALITPEDYLELERAAETKGEYYRGEMLAMGRVSLVHTIIVVNIGSELHNQLRTRDCTVHASLMEYLTLAQDRSHADHYTRQPDNSWLLREIEAAGSISLKCIAAELPLDRIYEKMQCATS